MRILMSMFGWNDSGGGTILPRQTALALQASGHQVAVIYSAVEPLANQPQYSVREWQDQGVQLYAIHNRPALFLDATRPDREREDPEVKKIVAYISTRFQPDIVHYHNFLGLSIAIAEIAHQADIPSFYTPYNFWLICPTLYLNLPDLQVCQGVNETGSNCLTCTQAYLPGEAYLERRDQIRAAYQAYVGTCLASSVCVKDLLVSNGYATEQVEILKFGNDRAVALWQEVGQARQPAITQRLVFGFLGAVIPIKGVHILVAAVQALSGDFVVRIHGDGPEHYLNYLKTLDQRGCVEFKGRFADEEQGQLLSQVNLGIVPSVCYDHSPLVIDEFQAARVPVIGANIGGIPDYLRAGALFEAANPDDLARVLQGFLDHPEQILRLQAQLEAPQSFEDYVSSLLDRYRRRLQEQPDRYLRQQILARLQASADTIRKLQANSLEPIREATEPFGLNLTRPEDLEHTSSSELAQASWVRLAYPALADGLELDHRVNVIYPLRTPSQSQSLEKLSDQSQQVLVPIANLSSNWDKIVLAFCQAYPIDADILLILLTAADQIEALESQLLDVFARNGIDPEQIPELMLLEQTSDAETQDLFAHLQGVFIPDSFEPDLFWKSQAAPLICTNQVTDPALFVARETPDWLAPLLTYFDGSVYQPKYALEAHNQLMIERFETLIKTSHQTH